MITESRMRLTMGIYWLKEERVLIWKRAGRTWVWLEGDEGTDIITALKYEILKNDIEINLEGMILL